MLYRGSKFKKVYLEEYNKEFQDNRSFRMNLSRSQRQD